jgi:hypothetical protein
VFIGLVIVLVILDPISDNNQDTKSMIYFVLLSAGMIAILVFEHDMIKKWLENRKEEKRVLRDYYWEQEQRKNPLFKYYSEESLEEMKEEIVKELLFREEYVKKMIDGEEIGEELAEIANERYEAMSKGVIIRIKEKWELRRLEEKIKVELELREEVKSAIEENRTIKMEYWGLILERGIVK